MYASCGLRLGHGCIYSKFPVLSITMRVPGISVGIATDYWLDGPGIESGGGEIFRTCPDRRWGPPSLLYNGYRVFPGGKQRPGRDADPSPLLVPWSRNSIAIPLLPLRAVRPVQRCILPFIVLWYHYATQTKDMYNLLDKYLISVVFYMFRTSWVHPQGDSRACKTHRTAYTAVFLRMNPRGSKHVEDTRYWILI